MQVERLRSWSLEDIRRALGYGCASEDDARWRNLESVVSINGFMFYDHQRGEWGARAVNLVVHANRCTASNQRVTSAWVIRSSGIKLKSGSRRLATALA